MFNIQIKTIKIDLPSKDTFSIFYQFILNYLEKGNFFIIIYFQYKVIYFSLKKIYF